MAQRRNTRFELWTGNLSVTYRLSHASARILRTILSLHDPQKQIKNNFPLLQQFLEQNLTILTNQVVLQHLTITWRLDFFNVIYTQVITVFQYYFRSNDRVIALMTSSSSKRRCGSIWKASLWRHVDGQVCTLDLLQTHCESHMVVKSFDVGLVMIIFFEKRSGVWSL